MRYNYVLASSDFESESIYACDVIIYLIQCIMYAHLDTHYIHLVLVTSIDP